MKTLLALGAVAVGVGLLWVLLHHRSGDGPTVTVSDIPEGVAKLQQHGREHAFLVFLFTPRQGEDAINLQYSIQRGHLGLDWVLIGSANIADKAKVEAFVTERGHSFREKEMNGVRFVRIEDGDLARLGLHIVTDLYGLNLTARLGTVVDGFDWRPLAR